MAPGVGSNFAFGQRGSNWAKKWQILGESLGPQIDSRGLLTSDYYEILVLGECHTCNIDGGQIEAPALDLQNLRSVHQKDRKLQDNFVRLPLMCKCMEREGSNRRPVGIRSIILKLKHAGKFEVQCKAQCYNCQTKCEVIPAPDVAALGQYQQLLAMQCCNAPMVKVTTLKMHFTPELEPLSNDRLQRILSTSVEPVKGGSSILQSVGPPPPPPQPPVKACSICFEEVKDAVKCRECPVVYHAKCQREWLSRRRHLMAPKCLYCFGPLTHDEDLNNLLDVHDVYIHANSLDSASLDELKKALPGLQDHIVRLPKRDPKKDARSSSRSGRPPLYLAWYRFLSEAARDAAYSYAVNHGLQRKLGLRTLDKGSNKLRSHRKFGEVYGE